MRHLRRLLAILSIVLSGVFPSPSMGEETLHRQSLDGVWKATWFDGQRGGDRKGVDKPLADLSSYIDATVPGEIHQDLMPSIPYSIPWAGETPPVIKDVESTRP